MVVGAGFEPA